MKTIILGFEIGTGKIIEISPSHLICCGVTQLSGKTTTLEALIKRSGFKAIVFKTKIGETGFNEGTTIPPYFKERSDWQYVQSLLEATLKEKLKFERSWIIRACKNADSLIKVKNNIDEILAKERLRQMDRDIFTTLQAYLELVLPQLQSTSFSKTLDMQEGTNIMDLERFSSEIQSLVIRSVLETVLKEHKNTVVVIPEAWKFLPQARGNPCKQVAEEFIRQGATNKNFLWIDSQDMTGVDKTPLKQVSTWIMGLQTEKNEVVRTLDQVPLPKSQKPKPDEIMTLRVGHFYLCSPNLTLKIYVWPVWIEKDVAKDVALGKKTIDDLRKPRRTPPQPIQPPKQAPVIKEHKTDRELIEMRHDFFNKIQELQNGLTSLSQEIYKVQSQKAHIDVDEIVSLVMQKMPINNVPMAQINEEGIVEKVLARIPKVAGAVTYKVAPLEKIQKDFLEGAKNKILTDIGGLDDDQKRMLKWIEQNAKNTKKAELFLNCFGKSTTTGSAYQTKAKKVTEMKHLEVIRVDTQQRIFPHLKERIRKLIEQYGASEQEIEQVFNHILAELL